MDPSELVEEGWINTRMIIEAQGKPEKHVIKNLNSLKDQMASLKGVEVYEEKMGEPNEEEDGLISALIDIGVVVKDLDTLMQLVLNYGPSATIIIEPEEIKVDFRELQNVINDVSNFLHQISQENFKLRVQNLAAAQKLKTKE